MKRLPRSAARIALQVRQFMEQELHLSKPWPRCVAAVSGGADSTALVCILHALEVPLLVAHLDHALRPESADEARHVTALAESLGVPLHSERCDVQAQAQAWGTGLEDAGRRCRYAMLERLRSEHQAEWIVTGHHLDDLSEDVLLRLIRGSGWPALAGMRARDDERRLLRPLLHTTRAELEAFLRIQGHSWCTDSSNAERAARRNRIRLDILPRIHKENPAFSESVRRLWQLARLDENYWQAQVGAYVPIVQDEQRAFLERTVLEGLLPVARLRLYLATVRRLCLHGSGQARLEALTTLDGLWQNKRTGAIVQMPGVEARVLRAGIEFLLACGGHRD